MKKVFKHFPINIIPLLVIAFLLLPKVVDFIQYVITILQYPYVWALTENENMLFIHEIIFGDPVYKLTDVNTFSYFVYPPFFHLFSVFFIKLFDFTILIPRLISIFSFVTFSVVLWLFFKEKGKWLENTLVTYILVASTVAITLYSKYFILARADMLSYTFSFVSVFFVWKLIYLDQQKRNYYLLAGIMALAAFFTKQSVFFPYIFIAVLFFFVKDRRRWFMFGAMLALATGLCLLILNLSTQGEFLKSMQLAQEVYGKYLNSQRHLFWLQSSFIDHYRGFLFGIIFLIYLSYHRIFINKTRPLFSVLLALALSINFLITGGNGGAAYNTMIPVLFGVMIAMKELYFLPKINTFEKYAKVVFICVIISQLFIYKKFYFPYDMPTMVDRQNQALLVSELKKSSNDWVLGDRVDYATLLAGKKYPLEASTHNVAREWSKTNPYAAYVEKKLIERMKNKDIDLAVTGITKLGHGDLLSYVTLKGKLIKTVRITYMDAANLDHKIYQLP